MTSSGSHMESRSSQRTLKLHFEFNNNNSSNSLLATDDIDFASTTKPASIHTSSQNNSNNSNYDRKTPSSENSNTETNNNYKKRNSNNSSRKRSNNKNSNRFNSSIRIQHDHKFPTIQCTIINEHVLPATSNNDHTTTIATELPPNPGTAEHEHCDPPIIRRIVRNEHAGLPDNETNQPAGVRPNPLSPTSASQKSRPTHRSTPNLHSQQRRGFRDFSSNKQNRKKTFINSTSSIINLSRRQLTEAEKSVLDLGLTFSPSNNQYNKEELAHDMYNFIRKLRIREYFHNTTNNKVNNSSSNGDIDNNNIQSSNNNNNANSNANLLQSVSNTTEAIDRADSKWEYRNPNWYPDKVKNNRSPDLTSFITNFQHDIHKTLTENESKFWNNLSPDERQALKTLANDQNIVIKPADKGGAIVIMNIEDYEKACNDHLSDANFYEQLPENPTTTYKESIISAVDDMYKQGLVSDFERATLITGDRTPHFYGLPKIHKDYNTIPKIRPICSGSSGPTASASEYIDTFLKPIAQKQKSFVKDTTDFINKTKELEVTDNDLMVTMDVTSLYTNIDQKEGRDTCESFLNLRSLPSVPTHFITKLIDIILHSNTMFFNGQFFHQIKGTAMGTSMAVNFANLFMSQLEQDMLRDYEQEYGVRPTSWLRYIDDIFFVWSHGETQLKHFLQYCNSYTDNKNMQSNIKFTSAYSQKEVSFLDVKAKFMEGRIITDLYTKLTSVQNYLHRSSFHPPSLIRSIPKTQFIRLRRICSRLTDFDSHCKDFVNHFVRRGYSEKSVSKAVFEVRAMNRDDLLTYQQKPSSSNRTILSMRWHPKFRHFPSILRQCYNSITAIS